MFNQDPKPVDLFLLQNTAIDGTHYAAGEILPKVAGDLAMELCGQGKARVATAEDAKPAKK